MRSVKKLELPVIRSLRQARVLEYGQKESTPEIGLTEKAVEMGACLRAESRPWQQDEKEQRFTIPLRGVLPITVISTYQLSESNQEMAVRKQRVLKVTVGK
jgi:hypothetical protein